MAQDEKPRRRSGGPRTPEGKARSAQNARKHGLCAELLLLTVEEGSALDRMTRAFQAEYRPVGPTECHLVHEMVGAAWREHRSQSMETASLDITMHRDQPDVDAAFAIMDGASRAALAVEHRSPNGVLLVNFARYETSFHRIFHRALNQLLVLQERRMSKAPPHPGPTQAPESEITKRTASGGP